MKKIVFLVFVLMLLSLAVVVRFTKSVIADGTVYIKADGSVEPPDAPISSVDNITYTFTADIYDSIVVERDNIVVDGAGYNLQGTGAYDSKGIDLTGRSNITIKNMEIKAFYYGIWLYTSSDNTISGNHIRKNTNGIELHWSSNNTISGNDITNNTNGVGFNKSSNNTISGNHITENNYDGIWLEGYSNNSSINGNNITNNGEEGIGLYTSSSNTISGNDIANNHYGIWLAESSNNIMYHNNFINNTQQVYDYSWDWPAISPSINIWDDGYYSGGNYWSNYTGVDPDHDGIGNSPHIIDENNQDSYPLMGMFYDFTVEKVLGQFYHVIVISNSTVSDLELVVWLSSPTEYLQPGQELIFFIVTGEGSSVGFCRILIPRAVLNGPYIVLVDGHEVPATELPISNSTHAYLYFTYIHSMHEVIIVPEFPVWISMLLILVMLTVTIAIYKRRLLKTPIH